MASVASSPFAEATESRLGARCIASVTPPAAWSELVLTPLVMTEAEPGGAGRLLCRCRGRSCSISAPSDNC